MSYGLYLLKRICPNPEEYAARSVELLNLHASVEEIVHNIDSIVDSPLQTELHEIKTIRKNLAKPPKAPKKSAILKDKPLANAIVESAQQSTVEHIIAQSDSDNEHDDLSHVFGPPSPSETPIVTKTKKLKIVSSPLVAAAEEAVHTALNNDDKQKKAEDKKKKEEEKKKKEEEREAEKKKKEEEKQKKEEEKKKKEEEREQEKKKKEEEKKKKEEEREAEKKKKEEEKKKKEEERASKVKSVVKAVVTNELVAEQER